MTPSRTVFSLFRERSQWKRRRKDSIIREKMRISKIALTNQRIVKESREVRKMSELQKKYQIDTEENKKFQEEIRKTC